MSASDLSSPPRTPGRPGSGLEREKPSVGRSGLVPRIHYRRYRPLDEG
jgi:hypothetical protein